MVSALNFHYADTEDETVQKATQTVESVLNMIKRNLNEMTVPLNVFRLKPVTEETAVCTDGVHLFFNASDILRSCRTAQQRKSLSERIIHIAFHGILGHFETWDNYRNTKLISAVMDIQAERLMQIMGVKTACREEDREYDGEYDDYGTSLYYRALEDRKEFRKIKEKANYAKSDDHRTWMVKEDKKGQRGMGQNGGSGKNEDSAGEAGKNAWKAGEGSGTAGKNAGDSAGEAGKKSGTAGDSDSRTEAAKAWRDAREAMFGRTAQGDIFQFAGEMLAKR